MSDFVNPFQDRSEIMRHAAIEAKDAEITRLRAAINDALTAPFPDPELNSTWHQEPIGPNETPEEAIKRLVSVRAEWEVHKNNCENPVIAELRAELAAARCNDMGDAWIAQKQAWQEAIEDALLNWCDCVFLEDEAPKDALRRLIQHEITAALDPAVSQSAADLVATARREGMEEAAQRCELPCIGDDMNAYGNYFAAAIRAAAGEVK